MMSEFRSRDRRYLWRPYTSSIQHGSYDDPIVTHAEGSFFYTKDGAKLFDASASWWCKNLGHRHPRVVERIKKQSESFLHVPLAALTHEPAVRLAEQLAKVAPGKLERVFFSDNGSTAIEVALKIATQYFKNRDLINKRHFARLPGGYHGDTVAAMSVSGVDVFSSPFEDMMFKSFAPEQDPDDTSWEDVFSELCTLVEEQKNSLAAVIVEPLVQGAGGMRMYPAKLLLELENVCRVNDVLLIVDEIFTGFGRTGKMWACDHVGIEPDILATSKGLTAGEIPLSATIATPRVYDAFRGERDRCLLHGHTFCANPLATSVGLEVLSIFQEERVLQKAENLSQELKTSWRVFSDIGSVHNVRTLGAIAAFEIGEERGYLGKLGWKIQQLALKNGVHLRPLGNTIYFVPSLLTDSSDLNMALDGIYSAVQAALREEPADASSVEKR